MEQVYSLDFFLEASLSLDVHVSVAVRSTQLKLVNQLHLFFEMSDLAMVTHDLVIFTWIPVTSFIWSAFEGWS